MSSPRSANTEIQREKWSERGDLNSRPPVPQTGALTELRYAPTLETKHFRELAARTNSGLPPDCHRNWSISAGFCSRKSPVSTAAPSSLIAPGATASSVRARAPIQAGSLTEACSFISTGRDWRPAPQESAGAKVHRLTIEKKIELQCSYATAMEKVLSDPANAALKREFARSP